VIAQVSALTRFAGTSRSLVKLRTPSAGGTHLVVAFVLKGVRLPAITCVIDSLGFRWRLATDTQMGSARAIYFLRPSSPAGVTELTAIPANNIEITGYGLALEAAGVSQGHAVQALSDLVLEMAGQE
jgi:hypothetical protein